MRGRVFSRSCSALQRWAAQLVQPQVLELRCLSFRGHKSLVLPRQLLTSADQTHISFTVRWPLLDIRAPQGVSVRLWAFGSPPELQSSSPAVPQAFTPRVSLLEMGNSWELEQATTRRSTQVRIQLARQAMQGQGAIHIEIRDLVRQNLVSRLHFEVIDEARAQRLRVAGLAVQALHLRILSGPCQHTGNQMAETSDFLVPEFTVLASEMGAILPPCEANLALSLVAGDHCIPLQSKRILLGAGPLSIEGIPVSLHDRVLFSGPGPYQLAATVDGREIVRLPFRILSQREWLEQVSVSRIELAAETVNNQVRREIGALHWGTHVGFRPGLHIDTAVPAPNSPVKCAARIMVGQTVLRTEELIIRLNETSREVWLHKFNLLELGASLQGKHVRLTLAVHLNDTLKLSWPVIIVPPERLTNFEGQLNRSHRELPADDAAYEEIIARITGNDPKT